MSDIFLSYKREDEARVRPLVQTLEAEGLAVFWDRMITGGENWHERIWEELQDAGCVIVAWSEASVRSEAEFVREEARDARDREVLLPVCIDAVRPPLGFTERQALDLVGWGGDRTDLRFLDLLAAIRAQLHGGPRPVPRWPTRRRRRRVLGWSLGAPAIAIAVLMVSTDARRMVCHVPGVRSLCVATGLGEVPTEAEQSAWQDALGMSSGDGLREYLRAHPRGVYAQEVRARLDGCRNEDQVHWDDQTKRHVLTLLPEPEPHPTEQDAQRSTREQAPKEAAALCHSYRAGVSDAFRLRSASFALDRSDCRPRQDGYVCTLHGFAVCEVQKRRTVTRELCNEDGP